MAVTRTEATPEEKAAEDKDIRERKDDVAEKLFDNLDLSFDDDKKEEKPAEKKESKEEPEEEEEEQEEEEDQAEDEDEDEEEEVVPVSKMKKRINAEKAKRQIAEAELAELKSKQEKPQDSRRDRLESMNERELKELKVKAKAELRELIRTGEDPKREGQVDELVDEINDVLTSAPNRFKDAQVQAYDKAVRKTMDDGEIDIEKHGLDIKEIAAGIYSRFPDLQKLKTGQATAWKMAVEHFVEVSKSSKGKSGERKFKQQRNKQKRKEALDSSSPKHRMDRTSFKKGREEAKGAQSIRKREEFVESLLDVDKYLPPKLREKG